MLITKACECEEGRREEERGALTDSCPSSRLDSGSKLIVGYISLAAFVAVAYKLTSCCSPTYSTYSYLKNGPNPNYIM